MALTKVSYGVITADASSADLNIDANTLFVDSSANKVGVGTTSPTQKLDVNGNIAVGYDSSSTNQILKGYTTNHDSGNQGGILQLGIHDGSFAGIKVVNTASSVTNYNSQYISFDTHEGAVSVAERMRITPTGNVGIGQTAPDERLHISGGGIKVDGEATIASGSGTGVFLDYASNVGRITALDQGTAWRSLRLNAADIQFYIANGEKVRIDSSGRVLIGTTSSQHSSADLQIIGGAGNFARIMLKDQDGTNQNAFIDETGGNLVFTSQNGTSHGVTRFTTFNGTDTTERMRVHSDGNVGIGTVSPQYKFDIYGEDDVTMRIHRPSSGLAATDTCGIGFSQRGDANTSSSDTRAGIFSTYNGDLFLAVEAGGNLNSNPMDHSALFIEGANGRVGIGTTSPSESLEVNLGDMKVQGGANASTRGLIIAHTGQTGNLTMLRQDSTSSRGILETTERNLRISAGSAGGTGTAETLDFFVNGAERMMIDTSGKVGIGTGDPANNLHIHCDNGDEGILVKSTGDTSNTFVFDANRGNAGAVLGNFVGKWNGTAVCDIRYHSGGDTTNKDNGQIKFYTAEAGSTAERMVIDDEGNVGIGTSGPTGKLQVNHGTAHVIFTGPTGNGGGALILRSSNASTADNQEYGMLNYQNNAGQALAQIVGKSEGTGNDKGHLEFNTKSGAGAMSNRMRIRDNGMVQVTGALSKGSGSFEIPHPLESKKDTHLLRHSFIEGPQCDNIYRGTIELLNGTATVDLDAKFTMTNGTFVALNRNVQVFTTNESDWDNVKGSVVGNTLTITCQNSSSNATVSWLVVGERQDDNIKSSTITNNDGKLILEPEVYEGGT